MVKKLSKSKAQVQVIITGLIVSLLQLNFIQIKEENLVHMEKEEQAWNPGLYRVSHSKVNKVI